MGRCSRKLIVKQAVLFIAFAMLAGCSGISVTSDWDPGVDFSQFRTFTVLEQPQPSINRFVHQRIRSAIVAELTARGLGQVDSPDKADLAIGYQVTTEERTAWHTVHDRRWGSAGYRRSRAHWSAPVGRGRTVPINFTVGTLVIAAFQIGEKELVWEGSASGAVDPASGPEQSERRINDAVQRIFEDFPRRVTSRP